MRFLARLLMMLGTAVVASVLTLSLIWWLPIPTLQPTPGLINAKDIPAPIVIGDLSETPDQQVKLYDEVLSYRAMTSYLKTFAPIALLMILTLGSGGGYYFVRANVLERFADAQKALESQVRQASDTLRTDVSRAADDRERDLARRLEESADAKLSQLEGTVQVRLNLALASTHAALARQCWRGSEHLRAKDHAVRAIGCLDEALAVRSISNESRLTALRSKMFYQGDLAYYCAEAYAAGHQPGDRDEALRLARLMPTIFDDPPPTAPLFDGYDDKLEFIDSYLFVLMQAASGPLGYLADADKAVWISIYGGYAADLRDYMVRSGQGNKKVDAYDAFLARLRSPAAPKGPVAEG